jgi:AAA15 family ATPase/GTPase
MSERLIIHDFAGIRNLAIDLKRINILIGPTASGKSICAKLCFYFKGIVGAIVEAVLQEQTWDDFLERMRAKFEDFFSSSAWQNSSRISYRIEEFLIEITCDANRKVLINLPEAYRTVFLGLQEVFNEEISESSSSIDWQVNSIGRRFNLFQYLRRSWEMRLVREQIFIPAGRSFFSNLENNIFNVLSTPASLDSFLISFGQSYENSKVYRRKVKNFANRQSFLIQQLILKVSMGEYCYLNNSDCLKNPDGRVIELRQASSGQQEAVPMLLLLENLLNESSFSGYKTIYIEEPEAHLFPKTQRDIVNLIVGIFRESQLDLQFFITTHSPYILTAFNNLLQASEVHRHDLSLIDRQSLEAVVPEALGLAIDDIAVYSLSNGQCHNLISQDLGLIDTSIIDDVSNEMSIEFGQLLDLAG